MELNEKIVGYAAVLIGRSCSGRFGIGFPEQQ